MICGVMQRQRKLPCSLPMFQYFFDHVFCFRALSGLPLFYAHLTDQNVVFGECLDILIDAIQEHRICDCCMNSGVSIMQSPFIVFLEDQ